MATIRRKSGNALDDLVGERQRMLRDMLPAIHQAQELMRQFDSVRPLIEAAQRNDQLMRQAAEGLKFNSPALELAHNLTAASDTMKDALRVDTSMLDIGRTLAAQMDTPAPMPSALQIDTSALDAMKSLTLTSDAIRNALQADTTAFSAATKALSLQVETAAAMKAALQIDTSAMDWAKSIAPQFDTVRPLMAALQHAMPEFQRFELSPAIHDAMKNLSAMNMAPQLAAALEPPAGLADLMRDLTKFRTSIDMPALYQAQQAAASIAASMRLSDLTPERFGIVLTEAEADAAFLRLLLKARAIAEKDDATTEDVIAFAAAADAATAAAPAKDKGKVAVYVHMLWVALIVDLLKDGIIEAGKTFLLPYLVVLPLSFQPVPLPALPPAPVPFTAPASPDMLGVPRAWEVQGLPQIVRRAGPEAERRTLEFFETGISNRNTRQAYAQAVMRFMRWAENRNLELTDITVFTVSAYVAEMSREYSARSVRQHLGAIRGLFDYLVGGKVVAVNPASSVRGPQDDGAATKTLAPALQPQQIRLLLDSIDTDDYSGLRDGALIATMAYGFARVSAAVAMDVQDYFERDGRGWLRLRGRHGSCEIPLHPKAQVYLDAYVAAADIAGQPDTPLWRTMTKERAFSGERLSRVDVFRMVKRRLRHAGLPGTASCDSIRAAGIAAFLAGGGTTARAAVQIEPRAGITPADIDSMEI
ncbi:MAG: site-specific integrase [Vicinamibacterales bacterium]